MNRYTEYIMNQKTTEKKSLRAWAIEQFKITGQKHPNFYLIRKASAKAGVLGIGEMHGGRVGRLLTADEWRQVMEAM